jgi:hypothetical protein
MAASFLLQDWNTVRGNFTTVTVTQQESDYADLAPFQDVVVFIEVADVAGTPTIQIQTSPTKDDVLFQSMDATASFNPSVGVATKVLRYSSVTVPLARYLRWKFTTASSAPWSCTFRIWLSPNLS